MPVYILPEEHIFPPATHAEDNGLLAVGGDLSAERIMAAYSLGIFPWYSMDDPILWWSPDPRLILSPTDLKVSRSLRQVIKSDIFTVTLDRAFESVINECATVHQHNHGDTWITDEMIDAYIELHRLGHAHSVECWSDEKLVGGLYGISMGSVFFGESMFMKKSNASKVAFVKLVQQLQRWGFSIIDCQVTTSHLQSFGAQEIPRKEFLKLVTQALKTPGKNGIWDFEE
ncbi:MAG: leucyl/phenylalanyl-tRNA--protein transferase [Nitrospira sp.]|nr:leucyl/phenylalanyl-tRNA--protein transferase [Nitrospira sp.]